MATNRGDALLQALRVCLLTVSGLPADRRWQNTTGDPVPTAEFVADGFSTIDTEPRECGPGAWGRTTAQYRVSIRVPLGTDAHRVMALGVAIADAFRQASLTVTGYRIEVTDTRSGPMLQEPQWLHLPVYVSLNYDHP